MIEELRFVLNDDWQKTLLKRPVADKFKHLGRFLVPAARGIKYCVDERPIKRILEDDQIKSDFVYQQKAALPGGSLFWVTLFQSLGHSLEAAVTLTKELHQFMGWGKMEIHLDSHHGSLENVVHQKDGVLGCGFLGVRAEVVKGIKKLLEANLPLKELPPQPLSEVILKTYQAGARVIELDGEHKAVEAAYVINCRVGYTLPQPQLYQTPTPAFVTDLWVIDDRNNRGESVAEVINTQLGYSFFTTSLLKKFTLLTTLITAQLLAAYRTDNIFLIPNEK